MRRAQVVIYESDGRLTALLRDRAAAQHWWLREVRHPGAALKLLRRGGVLLLRVGQDLERELALLERAARLYPGAPAVVVGDSTNPALAGLCWDLGARFVLFPPAPRELLADVVAGLLAAPPAAEG
jgi:hypothetical protein